MSAGRIDIDFIKSGTDEKDIDLFLNSNIPELNNVDQDRRFFENSENLLLAHFVAQAGIFPSVTQARKNGWNKEVPKGFSQFVIGKMKSMITILNIED